MNDRIGAVRLVSAGLLAAALTGGCDDPAGPTITTRSGVIAFTSDRGDSIHRYHVMPAAGGPARVIPLELDLVLIQPLAWSPDGRSIAFVARAASPSPTRPTNHQIFVARADGGGVRQLTTAPDNDADWPAWSPDGTTIAYYDNGVGAWGINLIGADGSNPRRLASTTRLAQSRPSWSPDGSRLTFAGRDDAGVWALYTMRADGTGLTAIFDNDFVRNPTWSPDGRTIAFTDDVPRDGRSGRRLGVVNVDGTGRRFLTPDDGFVEWPSWSLDGKSIVFQRVVLGSGASNLGIMDVASGLTTQLTEGSQADQRPSWGRAQ